MIGESGRDGPVLPRPGRQNGGRESGSGRVQGRRGRSGLGRSGDRVDPDRGGSTAGVEAARGRDPGNWRLGSGAVSGSRGRGTAGAVVWDDAVDADMASRLSLSDDRRGPCLLATRREWDDGAVRFNEGDPLGTFQGRSSSMRLIG